jgi:tRNA pseudouridine55 synthase
VTDGLVVVDKPPGWTSHDVVARCRRLFGQKRIGHAGTLDPGATGVLLVGLGRATRLLRFAGELPKSYVGEVVLGVATSTLDDGGEVVGRWDMHGASVEQLREAAAGFTGHLLQVPPMVSALKVGGRRLHQLARAGVEVEREARPVRVFRFDVTGWAEPGVARVEVDCSSGTYVRSLAADLGAALGGGAHLRNLRRTAIGPFREEEAISPDDLGPESVRPLLEAVRHLGTVVVGPESASTVSHGRPMARGELGGASGPGPWAVLDQEGRLLAVYEEAGDDRVRPSVVVVAHQ